MTDRAVSSALEDVMQALDAVLEDRCDENRHRLKRMLERWAKLAARHHSGMS